MAIFFNKVPSTYIASDSPILFEIIDTDEFTDQQITLNTIFEEKPIESITLDSVSLPYSKIDFTFEHNFKVGDRVVVYHTTTGNEKSYNGDYLVTKSVNDSGISDYHIVIDLIITSPFSLDDAFVGKTIKTSSDLNPANFDLSPVLKNKVQSSIQKSNTPYNGDSNVFKHRYFSGKEYTAEYNITGIVFESGNVSFQIDTTDEEIEIGDEIYIEIDDKIWSYDDNLFDSGQLGFTSSNTHYLRDGIPIFVNGQITEPSYNGNHKVDNNGILSSTSIRTTTPWVDPTPVEGGSIIYQGYPEWNKKKLKVVGKSTFSGFTTIITNLAWIQNDPNVTGRMVKVSSKIQSINDLTTSGNYLYNSSFDYLNYSTDQMDEYIIKQPSIPLNIDSSDNNISTTRNLPEERLKYSLIPKEGEEHILIYNTTNNQSMVIDFLDKNKTLLSQLEYNFLPSTENQYFPVSIKSLLQNSETVISGDPLSVIKDDVHYYECQVNGTYNKAVYFPNDGKDDQRQLVTDTNFQLPSGLYFQYNSYMLLDLEEIVNEGTTNKYHLLSIDNVVVSLEYSPIDNAFKYAWVEDVDQNQLYQFTLDMTYTADADGTLFLFYFERDQDTGDITIGLTNRSFDDFPDTTQKLITPSYVGKLSLGKTHRTTNNTVLPFIGTIYWFNIYEGLYKFEADVGSNPFNEAFGGEGNWFSFDPNNTAQQSTYKNLWSWWDFNEGELYSNFSYQDNADRYDSMSFQFNLINMVDNLKYGTPAIEDTVTQDPGNGVLSNKLLYRVDKRCERFTDPIYLSFIDSLGSLTSLAFKMKNKSFIESSKSSYYKHPVYDSNIPSGGDTVYHTKSRRSWTLTTDLFTDQLNSNTFFKDLMKSNEQYILIGDSDQFIPITVDTDSLEIMDEDDGVWSYTFDVIESIDNHRY